MDVSYFFGGHAGGSTSPDGLAALEAFADAGVHSHVIPLFSGAQPDSQFYVWLKVGEDAIVDKIF